jgi:gamma-glutamylcyclotransferase (GGCT)/AIG2-like uncharacterized protein YtfP
MNNLESKEGLKKVKYFAYGSNMCDEVMLERCPSCRSIGAAKLENYRLAFRRKLIRTGTGAADILDLPGMTVWGVLYEITQNDLAKLDEKEGYKVNDVPNSIYERIKVDVILKSTGSDQCIHTNVETYKVSTRHRQSKDIPPSLDYLDNMLKGASGYHLPENYIGFLNWLKQKIENKKIGDAYFQDALLVLSTDSRRGAKGLGLLKVSSSIAEKLKLRDFAAVIYEDKRCLAQLQLVDSLDDDSCQLDQSVRHILGILGRETYGFRVSITPIVGRRLGFPLVNPRTLMLKVCPPAWLDSEKNICILHENNIRLLGLNEGEYVRISTLTKLSESKYKIKEITLRVFSGCSSQIVVEGTETDYPDIQQIYLDLDGRNKLGIKEGMPIVVSADTWKLFTSRLSYYGITLFLGITALAPVVQTAFNLSNIASISLTLLLSALATLVLSIFDIRGKVQY